MATSFCHVFDCGSLFQHEYHTAMSHFRPVTGGGDQDEEENVDCEGVEDGYNGAFRDGDARSLQLTFGHV